MATDKQKLYLQGLGVDRRVDLDGLSKEESLGWIEELKSYSERLGLEPFEPLTVVALRKAGLREDALVVPPSRSVDVLPEAPVPVNGVPETAGPPATRTPVAIGADESWIKIEATMETTAHFGETLSLTVGGSEHRRKVVTESDVGELALRIRRLLRAQIEEFRAETDPFVNARSR